MITGESSSFIGAFLGALVSSFIGWVAWSAVTYFVGTTLFHGEATLGEMLRVIGFAQAPLLLNVLSFIPCLGSIISLVAWLLSLYTGYLAIKEGLDLDTGKTIATVAIGWVVAFVISLVVGMVFGVGMAGIGALGSALGR
ncbi:MAG TPA: Yip1 family protein [Anaerolineae bacterium]|nr:Yip1 family protein [Anaerolineae bacterium]HQK12514.1 Yip1 family protein [Anaerolineae bacterium]